MKDDIVRQELFKNYSQNGILSRRVRCYGKILFWEGVLHFAFLLKRILDIVLSLMFLVLLFPVFFITALAIFWEDPGKVFFNQIRVGKDGRHFKFYKFRSMVINAETLKGELFKHNESGDGVIFKMKQDPRITRVGKIIRKFSIDELPQLINVLNGDMSLVGPRPPVPKEVAAYTLEDRKRLHIVPGITCIWQISGRSDIPFKQQVQLDLQYIHSRSFPKDMIILFKTIPAILSGKGAY
jgi:lipopolysaccharide/colanic/teichoic acid biosynthesis glycosyltransferase